MMKLSLLLYFCFNFHFCFSGNLPQIIVAEFQKDGFVTNYSVDKMHTVYQASKIYNVSVSEILSYNNIEDPALIAKNQEIYIPIDLKKLYRGQSVEKFIDNSFIPIYYKVKPKETLYRIAKVYCNEDPSLMMRRNNLLTVELEIGQQLIIGWLPLPTSNVSNIKVPEDNNDVVHQVSESEIQDLEVDLKTANDIDINESIDNEAPEIKYTTEKGVAIWTKSSRGHSLYALHPTAKLNSKISLFNPVVGRTVEAKVIGRIPKGAYTEDVSVIISPATAVALGALDSRLQLVMKYVEPAQ